MSSTLHHRLHLTPGQATWKELTITGSSEHMGFFNETSKTKVLQLPAAGVWHGSVKQPNFDNSMNTRPNQNMGTGQWPENIWYFKIWYSKIKMPKV